MNLKHNQRTPKGVMARFEMGQQTTKLKSSFETKYKCAKVYFIVSIQHFNRVKF